MKLRTAIVLAIFALAANAAELTIGQGVVGAGKPTTLTVQLASGGEALTGVQFDLEYDATALDVSVEAGPLVAQAGKNLQSNLIQPGKRRVLIIGLNRNAIEDGVIATIHVTAKGQPEDGKTFPLHITVPSGTNAKATAVAVTAKDGSVTTEKRIKQ
jgi:hypothetical protein